MTVKHWLRTFFRRGQIQPLLEGLNETKLVDSELAFARFPTAVEVLETRLRAEAERRGDSEPNEHWIFEKIPGRITGHKKDGWYVCALGSRTRTEIVPPRPPERDPLFTNPWKGEEYFEWIDVLQSAYEAGDTYTFVELGAGWGRWSARAALAARALGKRFRLCLVEAEPQHLAWLHRHMSDNHIGADDFRVVPAAVGGSWGKEQFLIAPPENQPGFMFEDNARDWYGQAVFWGEVGDQPVDSYHGHPVYEGSGGWRTVEVERIPLSHVLEPYEFIDLVDFDTQGTEADAIEEGLSALNEKVRRLHIGTHGHELEGRISRTLQAAGWACVRSYRCQGEEETPFGKVSFCDGVQTWVNPRLASAPV